MPISDVELFPKEVQDARREIETQLERYSEFGVDCPPRLKEAIRYSLLSGGKRLRPLLVLTANQICGGEMSQAMPAACAVEMIHTYSLIHDDLPAMDDDDLRRGKPSCHIQFDEATAILAGDALIPLAFEVISRDCPEDVAAQCCQLLAVAAGANRLVGGQSDDLMAQFAEPNVETLQHIHHRKTGALLSVSLQLGARIAHATDQQVESLRKYGKHVGLAFQIVDDLLDLRGMVDTIGKRTGKDLEHGKMTYPAVLGADASEKMARHQVDAAIEHLQIFGKAAKPLELFANFVVERSH